MENEIEESWDEGLKPKERLFVLQYCAVQETFLNATESYRAVWTKIDKKTGERIVPTPETCQANGSRKKKELMSAIKKLMKIVQEQLDEENAYKVIHDIAEIALFNPGEILDSDGALKVPLESLGNKAKCIAQIIPQKDTGPRIVLADRDKYMDKLLKYLNLVRPETQVEVKLPVVEVTPKVTGKDVLEAVEKWNAKAQEE